MPDEYILVTVPLSSGEMYVDEANERGYKVIALLSYVEGADPTGLEDLFELIYKGRAEVIVDNGNKDELIKKLSKYDIKAVVAGSEAGVPSAERLAKALGLKGNDPSTIRYRNNKEGMFEALSNAGIRKIETYVVKNRNDIEEFWNKNECKKIVLKFAESGASVGVKIFSDLDSALEYYDVMVCKPDFIGRIGTDILVQEYIDGIEYIVNTVSYNGRHKVSDMLVYDKIEVDNNILYGRMRSLRRDTKVWNELIEYDLKVADAVDMKYGPSHNEIKVDDKGPVLIEVNARPMGASMTRPFLKRLNGNCIVDMSLDSVLNEVAFNEWPDIYEPQNGGFSYLPYVSETKMLSLAPIIELASNLKGFFTHNAHSLEPAEMVKTVDLHTAPVIIKFEGDEDYIDDLYERLKKVNELQDLYFRCEPLGVNEGITIPGMNGISAVMRSTDPFEGGSYDSIALIWNKEDLLQDRYSLFFRAIRSLHDGGSLLIPKGSYDTFPYGKEGLQCIAYLINMEYSYDENGCFIGLKKGLYC